MNATLPDFWFSDLWYFLAALIVLLLPGLAVQSWLRTDGPKGAAPKRDLISCLADTIALSITVSALVGLWLWVARIQLTGTVTAGLYVLCLLVIFAALLKRDLRLPGRNAIRGWLWNAMLALLLVSVLAAWRFYQARTLALPAWVDSVHHTLLVRVILEQGGLPRDYLPYIPAPAYYHYGFHLAAALHAFWAGISPDRAVLWFGQLLNAAVSLSVYRAAYAFQSERVEKANGLHIPPFVPALIAALLTGFAFHMPAYYLSWGRYTLLTGLILLGPGIATAFELRNYSRLRSLGIRLALLVAGMCAVHYFALILLGLFITALGIFSLVRGVQERNFSVPLRLAGWSLLGFVLALPWLVWVFEHTQQQIRLAPGLLADQTEGAQQRLADLRNYLVYLIGPRRNHILMGFSAAGLLASIRKPEMRPLALWAVMLCLLSLPWSPRIGPFRPDHYIIILFFPAAVLLADLLVQSIQALLSVFRVQGERSGLEPLTREAALALLVLVVGGLLAWGVRETRSIANPVTVIATQADARALEWVKANTPQAARFFTNGARWQSIFRGLDGGYWLMPYTGRFSLIPPNFYSLGSREYIQQIDGWAERAQSVDGCTPAFWEIVEEADLTHVYLREGAGVLQPAAMQNCPNLQLIYQADGIYIYQIGR